MITFSIDKESGTPAYRQIIEKIASLVKNGKLAPGDKLPPERELAETLGIARGTIKRAYEELDRSNVVEVIHGRGTFVSAKQDVIAEGRKEKAIKLIEATIKGLEDLKFSYREMRTFFDLKIIERSERIERFYIAAVDCNPEALTIYERQLGYLSNVRIVKILLDDLVKEDAPEEKVRDYDIIVTTMTHYAELVGMLPSLKEKIVKVVVSPSQASVINLATISSTQKVGIISESDKFSTIIKTKLKDFHILAKHIDSLFVKNEDHIDEFLRERDVVIVPPAYSLQGSKAKTDAFSRFRAKGGVIIRFDYQIERGSLVYIEERIKRILNARS